MTALPPALTAAIEAELQGVPVATLARAVDALSLRYREAGAAVRIAGLSDADVQAYLAYRLPATYAAIVAALDAAAASLPDWEPRSLLDVGSGPGTAAWAALDVWPALQHAVLIDRDPKLIAAGQRLARAAPPALHSAEWRRRSLTAPEPLPHCDLVVAAYVLGELPADSVDAAVERLWEACAGTLVLAEPGTPDGYALLQRLRGSLQQQGAHTLAPCPHEHECPLLGTDRWCRFVARLERSRLHRLAKRSELAYEDEPFAYVAMSRMLPDPYWARVVSRPRAGGRGHLELELCTEEGVSRVTVSRRDGAFYRTARKVRWGDALLGPGAADHGNG
jgi:ribosomal protein RSM22 (predicted rRNA methylase)